MTQEYVGIVLFNGIEMLDFCGPFEVNKRRIAIPRRP